jgi:hypothetical protein
MVEEKVETSTTVAAIPIEWSVPEGLITPFASNMVIQTMENYFKISFFEIKPPIQIDKTAPAPTKIRADYVAGIIVTPDRLLKFIEVLQRQYDRYIAKQPAA